jgi:hypothetical protein
MILSGHDEAPAQPHQSSERHGSATNWNVGPRVEVRVCRSYLRPPGICVAAIQRRDQAATNARSGNSSRAWDAVIEIASEPMIQSLLDGSANTCA